MISKEEVIMKLKEIPSNRYVNQLRPVLAVIIPLTVVLIIGYIIFELSDIMDYLSGMSFLVQIIAGSIIIFIAKYLIKLSDIINKNHSDVPPLIVGLFMGVYGVLPLLIFKGAFLMSIIVLIIIFFLGFNASKKDNEISINQEDLLDSIGKWINYLYHPISKTVLGVLLIFSTLHIGLLLSSTYSFDRFLFGGFLSALFGGSTINISYGQAISITLLAVIPALFSIYIAFELIEKKYQKIANIGFVLYFLIVGPGNALILSCTNKIVWIFISNLIIAFLSYRYYKYLKTRDDVIEDAL